MLNKILPSLFVLLFSGCTSANYQKTVSSVDLDRFMKKWYVIAGRFTWIEKGAHNAVEEYKYNIQDERIDINFYFNKGSFVGEVKRILQKAWIENRKTNAYWKVSPFWPLKFDYLVIALADDYSWTAIGVPNEKYLWIMADRPELSEEELNSIITKVKAAQYSVDDIVRVPQKWN